MRVVVCPEPSAWAELHRRLLGAIADDAAIPRPPVPLILAGWAYSNDVEKRQRWEATVSWAERHGLTHFIEEIPDAAMYAVAELMSYRVGPFGGPLYLEWSFDPKPRVGAEAAKKAVETLRTNWEEIAGKELSRVTAPLRLSGTKSRRLVVVADRNGVAPWGSWTALAAGEMRRQFTRFRAAVNHAIAPLTVDHIDFVHEPASQDR